MDLSGENNIPTNPKVRKFGVEIRPNPNARRVVSSINKNLVSLHPYPRVVNKRAIPSGDSLKNEVIHRPITRKYAAQIATANQPKKQPDSSSSFTVWEDIPFPSNDEQQHVPMSLELEEQPEATMADEKDNNMEIEMEDIFDETILDIDGPDAKNPLAVSEYVTDLYSHYKRIEKTVSSDYLSIQSDISENMRSILIDWLIEVHHKFDLREETLFLIINVIDRFLSKESVMKKNLQLVGLVAMLLACKYEEVSIPVVDDLIFISDKAYTRKDILQMEKLMLNKLQFNMSVPTAYVFIKRFLKAAESDKKLEFMSLYLTELSLVNYKMLKFSPSFLAAAAIYTAQCTLYGVKQWNKTCEWYSSYSEDQLLECSKLIVGFHQNASTGKLTGVYRKYSMSRFGYAAKSEPALFLLMDE
ncbi:G2/mitotic-specific cyclin-2-like [Impatiens glandulifera]|uniref:G2/mitotic-specific cyclin-2-like n=1 Tax=Impatiens glandulifera TaxID=253017 RepID=UPI001FB0EAA9|nr:G2/mitotic-specific cyclin-2-like [Impatiens glandulifera]